MRKSEGTIAIRMAMATNIYIMTTTECWTAVQVIIDSMVAKFDRIFRWRDFMRICQCEEKWITFIWNVVLSSVPREGGKALLMLYYDNTENFTETLECNTQYCHT